MFRIYKEIDYAKKLLEKGFISRNITHDLRILAKYYKYLKLKKPKIKQNIIDFLKKHRVSYNDVLYEKKVTEIMSHINTNNILDIDKIEITKNELNIIAELKDKKLEKILFVMLVLSKCNNWIIHNDIKIKKSKKKQIDLNENYFTTYEKINNIFGIAKVVVKKDKKTDLLRILKEKNLISLNVYMGFHINFAEEVLDGKDVVITITDFTDFVLEYEKYLGEKIINCENCGCLIKQNIHNKKYCDKCAKEIWEEQNRINNRERMRNIRDKNKFCNINNLKNP